MSTAIRRYLKEHAQLPKESLRTNIPVSLRTEADAQLSNHVTTTTVTLATNIANPAKRLQAIHTESEQAKKLAHAGGKGVVELFQMMPPILVSAIMETLPAEQAPQILGANLIVSNLRGSPVPMYIAGARMEKLYPMSIITAGMGINFTCMSYCEWMDFGIVVDPDLVPDHHSIADNLQDAFTLYLELCPADEKSRKKTSGKKPPVRKKAPAKKGSSQKGAQKDREEKEARKHDTIVNP